MTCLTDYDNNNYEQILSVKNFDQLLRDEPNPEPDLICYLYGESSKGVYVWGIVKDGKWVKAQILAAGEETRAVLEWPTLVVYV